MTADQRVYLRRLVALYTACAVGLVAVFRPGPEYRPAPAVTPAPYGFPSWGRRD